MIRSATPRARAGSQYGDRRSAARSQGRCHGGMRASGSSSRRRCKPSAIRAKRTASATMNSRFHTSARRSCSSTLMSLQMTVFQSTQFHSQETLSLAIRKAVPASTTSPTP